MNELLKKVTAALKEYGDKKLAVGVSGGRDSMCLLHAVLSCGIIRKQNITVVHVNHCLRKTADNDEAFVREYCAKNNVAFVSQKVNVNEIAAKNGLTIEQAARNLRYDVFYDLLKHDVAAVVLTAHHALDNAESVLMHLFRGAGLDGVRGMKRVADNRIVRPLIEVYPDEIDEYVKQNGIEYVTDETNFIDDADRNFIRLNVIPLIQQRYRGVVRAVNEFAAECDSASDYLFGALDVSKITYDGGAVLIDCGALESALGSRYVRRALEYFTLIDITREQIERVVNLANMRTGAVVELTGGIEAAKEYGRVALYVPREKSDAQVPVKLGANFIDGLAVDIKENDGEPLGVGCRYLDLDKTDGAVIRFRRDGDIFTPCGSVRKKLKQYLIDAKIPSRKRDRIPLICRGNEVLAIVGFRVSESVKITEKTVRVGIVSPRWQ